MAWHGSLRFHANVKVQSIRKRDMAQCGHCVMSAKDAIELALESNGTCCLCGCQLLFEYYQQRCRYQWSLDRIDRTIPHSKENVRLTCSSCNIAGPGAWKPPCLSGCHPGDLPRGFALSPPPAPEDIPPPKWTYTEPEDMPHPKWTLQPKWIFPQTSEIGDLLYRRMAEAKRRRVEC